MLHSLTPPFFSALEGSRRVLIAGMGGGFDVFCGLPLYFALRAEGLEVALANLSFVLFAALAPSALAPRPLAPSLIEVTADLRVQPGEYFPECYLSRWLASQGEPPAVYAIEKKGVQPTLAAYRALVEHLNIDTVILIDGGTDALMRGDEADLGTPHEDAVSLCAVNELEGVKRFVVSLGFGIDSFHGVSHWNVLEATAELARAGAYLGSFSLTPEMRPVQLYREACLEVFAQMPRYVSIVNSSILSAIDGEYGDAHASERTLGLELWINPLMAHVLVLRAGGGGEAASVPGSPDAHREQVEIRPRYTLPI